MNKAELIDELTKKMGSDRRQATAAVENVVDTIVRAVHKGDSVTITGFGVFEQRRRAARVARNPRTGETVKVKPTSVPAFRPGAQFKSLEKVPRLNGKTADLSRFPARRGFEDLVMLVSDVDLPFAWTAVAFQRQGFVWFALKNPRILRETVFWISNGGRHYPPWNGRHINVMGLEEVTSYFHLGLAESARRNPISAKGYPTFLSLNPRRPLRVPYIMGVARIPAGFDRVKSIDAVRGNQAITLRSANGKTVKARVNLDFLAEQGRTFRA